MRGGLCSIIILLTFKLHISLLWYELIPYIIYNMYMLYLLCASHYLIFIPVLCECGCFAVLLKREFNPHHVERLCHGAVAQRGKRFDASLPHSACRSVLEQDTEPKMSLLIESAAHR